ncbi:MAG: CHASE2 domain-containing protein, partial [Anaerolineae bacterium]|nr:CHASE2 domain-containing protein [Anaerolineae bacterium]
MQKLFNVNEADYSASRRHLLLILVVAATLILAEVMANFPDISSPIERMELAARDTSFRLRGKRIPEEDIVIVAIDDASLGWVDEHWPWPRRYLADIINWLNNAGARVIALDVFLFDASPDPADDQALVEALRNSRASVSVNQIFGIPTLMTHEMPEDIYLDVLDGFGITEVKRDDDAIVRGISAYKSFRNETYYNWAFEIASLYLGVPSPSSPSAAGVEFNGEIVPLNNQGVLLLNYAGPAKTYDTVSAAFVPLNDYPPELFQNKIVLIGASSETLQDIYPTPFSATNL